MPMSLQIELHQHVYAPMLKMHPLFSHWGDIDSGSVLQICHLAMVQRYCAPTHEVFLEGETATEMLFIKAGHLEYFAKRAFKDTQHSHGDWFCGAALWVPWRNQGTH